MEDIFIEIILVHTSEINLFSIPFWGNFANTFIRINLYYAISLWRNLVLENILIQGNPSGYWQHRGPSAHLCG
jgi:hypothetical protein